MRGRQEHGVPHTIGDDQPRPGTSSFQRTWSVTDQRSGTLPPGAMPLMLVAAEPGPRFVGTRRRRGQCGGEQNGRDKREENARHPREASTADVGPRHAGTGRTWRRMSRCAALAIAHGAASTASPVATPSAPLTRGIRVLSAAHWVIRWPVSFNRRAGDQEETNNYVSPGPPDLL